MPPQPPAPLASPVSTSGTDHGDFYSPKSEALITPKAAPGARDMAPKAVPKALLQVTESALQFVGVVHRLNVLTLPISLHQVTAPASA